MEVKGQPFLDNTPGCNPGHSTWGVYLYWKSGIRRRTVSVEDGTGYWWGMVRLSDGESWRERNHPEATTLRQQARCPGRAQNTQGVVPRVPWKTAGCGAGAGADRWLDDGIYC